MAARRKPRATVLPALPKAEREALIKFLESL